MRIICFGLVFLIVVSVSSMSLTFSQSKKDSLELELTRNCGPDSVRGDILLELASVNFGRSKENTLGYAGEALEIYSV